MQLLQHASLASAFLALGEAPPGGSGGPERAGSQAGRAVQCEELAFSRGHIEGARGLGLPHVPSTLDNEKPRSGVSQQEPFCILQL